MKTLSDEIIDYYEPEDKILLVSEVKHYMDKIKEEIEKKYISIVSLGVIEIIDKHLGDLK